MSAVLDAWLRAREDRCPDCGFHVARQGHRPSCAPTAPADQKAADYAYFKVALVEAAGPDLLITQTAMRPRIQRIPHKWRGQFYVKAKAEGVTEFAGKEPSTDVAGGNGDKDQKVWKLVAA